ncbi:MAG TPA: ATPase, T2SS/T4P/T4SS family, partial [Candidatus Baltobacteraceae bacterium]
MSSTFFAFVNAKGGSGATTICAELVKALRGDRSVAFVDGDLSGRRNAAILFDAVRTIDTVRETGPIGVAEVAGLTIAELAPAYDSAFTINFDDVEQLAASFSELDYVLTDVPIPFAAPVRPFVVRATRFIIVCEPTLLGIASARTTIAELKRFGVPLTRMVLATNCRDGSPTASRAEIERALEIKVMGELPPLHDRGYARAMQALEKTLRAISAEPKLEVLLPSARGLIHDRRAEPRTAARGVRSGAPENPSSGSNGTASRSHDSIDPREKLKLEIHETLSSKVNLVDASAAHSDSAKLQELRQKIEEAAQQVLSEKSHGSLTAEEIAQIKEEIVNESLGLGPLEDLMQDPAVTEIMVNGPKTVYIERSGKIERTGKRFTSGQQLRLVIERIIAPLGRRLDESVPMVDARLPDGSRVNAIIEPLAIDGASLTIRRFGTRRMTAQDLLDK